MEEQRKNSYDPNEDIVDRMWKRSKNSINLVIVVCNILVFLAVTLTGGTESSRHMMDCGAAYAPLIESGEYYRLFTSMFLHFGIQHLINNMLLLLFLGDYLERAVGKTRYLVIYLGGGLVGNLCSYLHELSLMKTGEAPAVSAGASGAIFSAVGAMLVLLAFRKGRLEDLTFRRMVVMAVLSLLVGFQSSNVDNFAHIGGFLAGAVLMAVLYPGMARDQEKGKTTVKVLPSPGTEETEIVPSCAVTISLQMASPRPVPFFLCVTKRSKRVGRSSAGIPQPVSCTRMVRKSPSKQREILIVPPEGIASAAFRIRFRKS